MKILKDKPKIKIEKHKWFAWYPVFAWEGEMLHGVWLEWVWRESGSILNYRHSIIKE